MKKTRQEFKVLLLGTLVFGFIVLAGCSDDSSGKKIENTISQTKDSPVTAQNTVALEAETQEPESEKQIDLNARFRGGPSSGSAQATIYPPVKLGQAGLPADSAREGSSSYTK